MGGAAAAALPASPPLGFATNLGTGIVDIVQQLGLDGMPVIHMLQQTSCHVLPHAMLLTTHNFRMHMSTAGVDFDVETMTGDPVACAEVLMVVVDIVRLAGVLISFAPQLVRRISDLRLSHVIDFSLVPSICRVYCAPQCDLYPGIKTIDDLWNQHAPLLDTSRIAGVDHVMVRMPTQHLSSPQMRVLWEM